MLIGSLLLIIVIFYFYNKSYNKSKVVENLDELLQKQALIIDVRSEVEYRAAHMDGSMNIPLGNLNAEQESLDKNQTIITCCSHGIRSVKAVKILQDNGFTDVHNGGSINNLKKLIK